jgi:lysozyme
VAWPTATWPQWTLWQFTDEARCDGINGYVDANRFNGSEEQLVKWMSPVGSSVPAPPIEPELTQVLVAITQPPGVQVTVTINGEFVVTG